MSFYLIEGNRVLKELLQSGGRRLRFTDDRRRRLAAKGRPGVMREIREVTVRMAEENPNWRYPRIQGALGHIDHRVARSTIAKILKEPAIEPSPESPLSCATFARSHAHLIAVADFFVTDVTRGSGTPSARSITRRT